MTRHWSAASTWVNLDWSLGLSVGGRITSCRKDIRILMPRACENATLCGFGKGELKLQMALRLLTWGATLGYPDRPSVITGSLRSGRGGPRDAAREGLHRPLLALKMAEEEAKPRNAVRPTHWCHEVGDPCLTLDLSQCKTVVHSYCCKPTKLR